MKKSIISVLKITIVVALLIPTIISCQKKDEVVPQVEKKTDSESSTKVDIVTLKGYMSKLINVKVSDISYDDKTEQFAIFGVDQINRESLTQSYQQSKNK